MLYLILFESVFLRKRILLHLNFGHIIIVIIVQWLKLIRHKLQLLPKFLLIHYITRISVSIPWRPGKLAQNLPGLLHGHTLEIFRLSIQNDIFLQKLVVGK
jgi:hypothetical protein